MIHPNSDSVSMTIPESKKDKAYHLEMANYIIARRLNWGARGSVARYWDWYHYNINPVEEHNMLMTSERGDAYPVDDPRINLIQSKIAISTGQLIDRGFEFHAEPHSKHAINRRRRGQSEIRVDYKLRNFYMEQQQLTGLPVVPPGLPQGQQGLEHQLKSYKEMGQIVTERHIDYEIRAQSLRNLIPLLWQDAHVSGSCHTIRRIYGGRGYLERIPSENVVWDTAGMDPFLSTGWCIASHEMLSQPEIQMRYGLDKSEFDSIVKEMDREHTSMLSLGNSSVLPQKVGSGADQRILVVTAYWKDLRKKVGVKSVSKKGVAHYGIHDFFTEKRQRNRGEQRDPFDAHQVRQAVVIGGQYIPDGQWGVVPYQVRSFGMGWNKAKFPIASWVPRMNNGRFLPTMELAIPNQKMISRCMIMINKAMRRDRGKISVDDVALRVSGATLMDNLANQEIYGAKEVNSRQYGIQTQANMAGVEDLSLSPSVGIYQSLIEMYNRMMEMSLGVSEGADNAIKAVAAEKTGVANILQQTKRNSQIPLHRAFFHFLERGMEIAIQQDRYLLIQDPNRFSDIVGDDGVKFISGEENFPYDQYGIFINSDPVRQEDRERIMQMLDRAMSSEKIDFADGMEMMLDRGREKELVAKLRAKMEEVEAERAQAQQDAMLAQQQFELQKSQMTFQEKEAERKMKQYISEMQQAGKMELLIEEAKRNMEVKRLEAETDLRRVKIQQGTSLTRDQLKLTADARN